MWAILTAMLLVWLICIVLGVIIKAVAWLIIVGVILFVLTLAFGVIHEVMSKYRHRM